MSSAYTLQASDFAETASINVVKLKQLIATKNTNDWFKAIKRQFLPDLKPLSDQIRACVIENGFAILKGLPVDNITSDPGLENKTWLSEALLICLTASLGRPLGYNTQRGGTVIQNIRPENLLRQHSASATTTGGLGWHTEDAALKYNCDYLALYCLKNDPKTKTFICRLDTLKLSRHISNTLSLAEYNIIPDGNYKTFVTNPQAIRSILNKQYVFRVDLEFTKCLTERSFRALRCLIEEADKSRIDFVLEPGDLLVIDNRKCIHGRTKIAYGSPDQLRWLQRLMIFRKRIPVELLNKNDLNIILS
jgi:L-asparagine oxygenase